MVSVAHRYAGPILAVLASLTAGCASREMTVDTSNIAVYDHRPGCKHTSLGPVTGRDGSLPKQDSSNYVKNAYGKPGSDKLALQRLKLAAVEKGADGVIIMRRDVTEAPQPRSGRGAQRRAASLVVYKGIAISGCGKG